MVLTVERISDKELEGWLTSKWLSVKNDWNGSNQHFWAPGGLGEPLRSVIIELLAARKLAAEAAAATSPGATEGIGLCLKLVSLLTEGVK